MNRLLLSAITLAAAAAGFAAGPSPASALVPIDDFEIGSFALATNGFNSCVFDTLPLNGYETHAFAPARILELCTFNGEATSTVSLVAGAELDDAVRFTAGGNPTDGFQISYRWGYPRTLTYDGAFDRIEVDLRAIIPGGFVAIRIYATDGIAIVQKPVTGAGVMAFPLSAFSGIDLTQVTKLEFFVSAFDEAGTFEIADIRLRGSGYWGTAQTVDFTGDFVAIDFPPIPSPPLSFRMTDAEGNWLYRTDVVVTQADGGVINPCFHADWSEAAAMGGEIAGVEFMGIQPEPFVEADFELTIDLLSAIRLGPIPQIVGEPALTAGPLGFLVTFPVLLTEVDGSEAGRSETRILFDIPEGQGLKFENVQLAPGGVSKQSSTNNLALSFSLEAFGDVDLAGPLFEAAWLADWSPQNVTGIGAPDAPRSESAPSGAIVLSAWPSVTREGAEIRASLPFAADGAIAIHDVSGRLVRTLAVTRGASSVRWDGRDERGEPTASGVFFARFEGVVANARAARILRVR